MLEGLANKSRSNLDGQLDMFSTVSVNAPSNFGSSFEYPMIAEFSTRDLLMQEKEASGMYFSGHLLDGYSKNVEAVKHIPLSEFVPDSEGDISFKDRQRVTVVGIINSVSPKTTKKEERMAFFTLEDRYASVGCIIFPAQFLKHSQHIRMDNAVIIEGNVSFRDEEDIQIIVSDVTPLTDNSLYVPPVPTEAKASVKEPEITENIPAKRPKKLYLRVSGRESREFMKAVNLIDIFEGATQVVFYTMEDKNYFSYSRPIAASDFVISELKLILGDENVVFK